MAAISTSSIHQYIEVEPDYYAAYEGYEPDLALIEQIKKLQPEAHVIVPSRYSCSDCARNMPMMARIADFLPGWTWDVYIHPEHRDRSADLGIIAIPTFIVYDREGGRELGRIIENPTSGSLERDLLDILR
jgi:thioredoxin family protein